jgi:hypothetical protein
MPMLWVEPILQTIKPEKYPSEWGQKPSSEDGLRDVNVHRLTLKFIPEEGGKVSVWCPEIDLAAFGTDEIDAEKNFLVAFYEAEDFFVRNREKLSDEMYQRFSIFDYPYFFDKVE